MIKITKEDIEILSTFGCRFCKAAALVPQDKEVGNHLHGKFKQTFFVCDADCGYAVPLQEMQLAIMAGRIEVGIVNSDTNDIK